MISIVSMKDRIWVCGYTILASAGSEGQQLFTSVVTFYSILYSATLLLTYFHSIMLILI